MRTTVLLVDSNCLLREGLRSLLSAGDQFEVIGEAGDGMAALQGALAHAPDLMLVDSQLPGLCGIETVAQIKRRRPSIRVVMLTDSTTDDCVRGSLRAGADGYVLKSASFDELLAALRSVAAGKRYLSPAVSSLLVDGYLDPTSNLRSSDRLTRLTARERSILQLIAQGRTNRATAQYLCVSQKTIEKHRANLMRKIGAHNATELMLAAMELGIVERPTFKRVTAPAHHAVQGSATGEPSHSPLTA